MTRSDAGLPDFERPPVAEVVLACGFDAVDGLNTAALFQFGFQELNETFPNIEEQPPYFPTLEKFDGAGDEPLVQLVTERPPSRLWYRNETGTRLVQLQRDWLACNWQNAGGMDPYPRYPVVEAFFVDTLHQLGDFLSRRDLAPIRPTSCEVTYVNHIFPVAGIWSGHGELEHVLRIVGSPDPAGFLPRPEGGQFQYRFVIPDSEGAPVGRLHVTAQPALRREDASPALLLTLTARGRPVDGEGEPGVLNFLRLGHEWVVRGFADVTTADMHQAWGRRA
jgi:uncharacterized protein (TIGR04255 family)